MYVILFIFGLAIGSFLNVVAMRYDGEHVVFDPKEIGGRSHCPHCKKTLRWFELIPLVSFVIQGGKCRRCKAPLSWRYPIMELLSGLIFIMVPFRFSFAVPAAFAAFHPVTNFLLLAVWIIAFEILLLIAAIDVKLYIIPDELNIAFFVVGILTTLIFAQGFGMGNPSFFGPYAFIFGLQTNVWMSHLVGAAFGVLFFGGIVFATRGKGMGLGDVKLALPLGLLFGWPDILGIAAFAFVIGAIVGVATIAFGKNTMKSAVPFGPFLVIGAVIVFLWASALFNLYFRMTGL